MKLRCHWTQQTHSQHEREKHEPSKCKKSLQWYSRHGSVISKVDLGQKPRLPYRTFHRNMLSQNQQSNTIHPSLESSRTPKHSRLHRPSPPWKAITIDLTPQRLCPVTDKVLKRKSARSLSSTLNQACFKQVLKYLHFLSSSKQRRDLPRQSILGLWIRYQSLRALLSRV